MGKVLNWVCLLVFFSHWWWSPKMQFRFNICAKWLHFTFPFRRDLYRFTWRIVGSAKSIPSLRPRTWCGMYSSHYLICFFTWPVYTSNYRDVQWSKTSLFYITNQPVREQYQNITTHPPIGRLDGFSSRIFQS